MVQSPCRGYAFFQARDDGNGSNSAIENSEKQLAFGDHLPESQNAKDVQGAGYDYANDDSSPSDGNPGSPDYSSTTGTGASGQPGIGGGSTGQTEFSNTTDEAPPGPTMHQLVATVSQSSFEVEDVEQAIATNYAVRSEQYPDFVLFSDVKGGKLIVMLLHKGIDVILNGHPAFARSSEHYVVVEQFRANNPDALADFRDSRMADVKAQRYLELAKAKTQAAALTVTIEIVASLPIIQSIAGLERALREGGAKNWADFGVSVLDDLATVATVGSSKAATGTLSLSVKAINRFNTSAKVLSGTSVVANSVMAGVQVTSAVQNHDATSAGLAVGQGLAILFGAMRSVHLKNRVGNAAAGEGAEKVAQRRPHIDTSDGPDGLPNPSQKPLAGSGAGGDIGIDAPNGVGRYSNGCNSHFSRPQISDIAGLVQFQCGSL